MQREENKPTRARARRTGNGVLGGDGGRFSHGTVGKGEKALVGQRRHFVSDERMERGEEGKWGFVTIPSILRFESS